MIVTLAATISLWIAVVLSPSGTLVAVAVESSLEDCKSITTRWREIRESDPSLKQYVITSCQEVRFSDQST